MHYLALIIALGFWIAAFVISWRQIRFHRNAETTTGKFVGWVPSRSGTTVHWYPLVSFLASNGQVYEVPVGFGRRPKPANPPSSAFVIRYTTDKPEKAQSASWLHFWMGPFLFFGFAIVMTAIFIQKLNHA